MLFLWFRTYFLSSFIAIISIRTTSIWISIWINWIVRYTYCMQRLRIQKSFIRVSTHLYSCKSYLNNNPLHHHELLLLILLHNHQIVPNKQQFCRILENPLPRLSKQSCIFITIQAGNTFEDPKNHNNIPDSITMAP